MPDVVSEDKGIAFSLHEIHDVAKNLIGLAGGSTVWALYGPMGAGKTTLVKALVAESGVHDTVASPTFSIVNQYESRQGQPIYHFDFYRIKNEMEAYDIGTDEYFDSGNWCLVEWPEKVPSLLPPDYFEIAIEIIDEQTRLIRYRKHG